MIIYCVEDDNGIRNMMMYALGSAGYETRGFSSADELFSALDSGEEKPSLIMLDIMLPGMDGIEILKTIRSRSDTMRIPVILATAKGTDYDKIIGLDSGADDYLAKPFGMVEMLGRVKGVLRRSENTVTSLHVGDLVMNCASHNVSLGGKRIILTLKEYDLLRVLMENKGATLTREQLTELVWDGECGKRTLDVHIGTLRTKLGEAGGYIETVRGVGYRISRKAGASEDT